MSKRAPVNTYLFQPEGKCDFVFIHAENEQKAKQIFKRDHKGSKVKRITLIVHYPQGK